MSQSFFFWWELTVSFPRLMTFLHFLYCCFRKAISQCGHLPFFFLASSFSGTWWTGQWTASMCRLYVAKEWYTQWWEIGGQSTSCNFRNNTHIHRFSLFDWLIDWFFPCLWRARTAIAELRYVSSGAGNYGYVGKEMMAVEWTSQ